MTTPQRPPGQIAAESRRIRNKRETCGLSRYGLACLCEVSSTTIRALEHGRPVKPVTLAKIETCLNALLAVSDPKGEP